MSVVRFVPQSPTSGFAREPRPLLGLVDFKGTPNEGRGGGGEEKLQRREGKGSNM